MNMIQVLKKIFGMKPPIDFGLMVKQGATILDVRSLREYSGGHVKGSVNISIDKLEEGLKHFPDKNKVIITCCATGARSAMAVRILKTRGYKNVFNGGNWLNLKSKL